MKDESFKLNSEISGLLARIGEQFYTDSPNAPFTLQEVDAFNESIILIDKFGEKNILPLHEFKEWENQTSPLAKASKIIGERFLQHHKGMAKRAGLTETASLEQINNVNIQRTTAALNKIDLRFGTGLEKLYVNFEDNLGKLLNNSLVDAIPESNLGKELASNCNLFLISLSKEYSKIKNPSNEATINKALQSLFERLLIYFENQNTKNQANYPETFEDWQRLYN